MRQPSGLFAVISVQVSLDMDQPVSGLTMGIVVALVVLANVRESVIIGPGGTPVGKGERRLLPRYVRSSDSISDSAWSLSHLKAKKQSPTCLLCAIVYFSDVVTMPQCGIFN